MVCEAFVREMHFSLWLNIFIVNPKYSGSELTECGGAMNNKKQKVGWFKGTFVETIKEWQRNWFYVTEPLAAGQAEVPTFLAAPPKKLMSWKKGRALPGGTQWIWRHCPCRSSGGLIRKTSRW